MIIIVEIEGEVSWVAEYVLCVGETIKTVQAREVIGSSSGSSSSTSIKWSGT
jgi:hypothetical protein